MATDGSSRGDGDSGGLRILVLADLAGGRTPDGASRPVAPDGIDELLRSLAPRIAVEVPNRLGTPEPAIRAEAAFSSLADFSADAISRSVPRLARFRRVSERLRSAAASGEAPAAVAGGVREELGDDLLAQSFRSGAAGAAGVDALLSKVALPAGSESSASLADLFGEAFASAEPTALARLAGELDLRVLLQAGAILESDPVRRLAESWGGLDFLLARGGDAVEVLPATREDFLDVFYERVFRAEYDGTAPVPLSLVLCDFAFERSPSELDLLRDAAKMGASLQIPFVVAAAPGFWGVRQAPLVATLPDLIEKMKGSEYAKWRAFRTEADSLWLALTTNRFLLRSLASGAAPLFGSAVWALGAVLAAGFREHGWEMPLLGAGSAGELRDLPVRDAKGGVSPVETLFSDRRSFELVETGFVPLVGAAGSDTTRFFGVPTYHAASRYEDPQATRASHLAATLPYQLYAGAVAHRLERTRAGTGPGLSNEQLTARFEAALRPLAGGPPGEGAPEPVSVEIADSADGGLAEVAVRLRPAFRILGGEIDLVVGTAVPR